VTNNKHADEILNTCTMEDFKENVTKIKNFKQAVEELAIPTNVKK